MDRMLDTMHQTLCLVLMIFVISINAQEDISDKVNLRVADQDMLESLMVDSTEKESNEEENVTEMEDVTMTTPITTPKLDTNSDSSIQENDNR